MIIKYCNRCSGKPYTTDMGMNKCPKCGSTLGIKTVQSDELEDCEELVFNSLTDESNNSDELEVGNSGSNEMDFPNNDSIVDFSTTNSNRSQSVVGDGDHVINGKIAQYSSSGKEDGKYHRLLITKIIDAVIYHQRFEDVLHRFKVRVSGASDAFGNIEFKDVWVNAHGTLSSGVQIADNSCVEVHGKYKNGVLMARKIYATDNGYKTPVNFQHSAKAIFYGILAIVAAFFMIYIGLSSDGGFFQNIGSFLKTWLITSVIVTVLYFLLSFSKIGIMTRMASGRPRKFPFVGILLVSLVLTLIFVNSFGLGASVGSLLSGLFSSIISIVVIIVVLYIVFKLLLGLF